MAHAGMGEDEYMYRIRILHSKFSDILELHSKFREVIDWPGALMLLLLRDYATFDYAK